MRKFLLITAAVAAMSTSALAQPLCNADCLLTGGKAGDYFRFFAPPVQKVLEKAWVDAPIAESPGSVASMDWVVANQHSYAFIQGDVLALAAKETPDTAKRLRIVKGSGIGDESVMAVVSERIYNRSQGSWGAIALHAKQVRFVTASEKSGPGATFRNLMALDPDNLGKARVRFLPSMDDAIAEVAAGTADVALMVQFGNPENPRFRTIAERKLPIIPVIMGSMRNLKLPDGSSAYRICEGVQVTPSQQITTACAPIQLVTGVDNDNPDLARVFASVTAADFQPRDSGFARFWKAIKVTATSTAESVFAKADEIAAAVSQKMN